MLTHLRPRPESNTARPPLTDEQCIRIALAAADALRANGEAERAEHVLGGLAWLLADNCQSLEAA